MSGPGTVLRGRRQTMNADRGATLMELLVGMSIMMIFLGIFTGAILILYQATNKANALTTSAAQTDDAFAHLDRTVRYAHSINTPGQNAAGTTWYVEFLSTGTGSQVCTQLRVTTAASGAGIAAQQLQARTWTEPLATGATAPTWTPWASGITNGTATAGSTTPVPFTLIPAGSSNVQFQQLTVQLVATSGSPPAAAGVHATFTALDSAGVTASSVCMDWGRP
jgi:hypothetical protein